MGRHEGSGLGSPRSKIALPYTLLVVIALLVLGIVAVDRGMKTLTERAKESQSILAHALADALENTVQDRLTRLEGISRLPSLKQMDPAHMDQEIHTARTMERGVTSFIVLDNNGTIVSFVDHPEHVGKSLAMRPYFQVARGEARPFISDSILTLDKTITVAVSMPIVDSLGKTVGVLAATFDVHHQNFNQMIQDARIGARGRAFLVDRQGIVISHPETRRSLEQQDFSQYLPVREAMSGERGVATYDFEGTPMLAAFTPVTRSGWGVVVQQPLADANTPAIQLRNLILTVMLFSAIAAALLGILISTRITAPLSRLEAVARAIGSGNLEEPLPDIRGGEIGTLARTLEAMRLGLKESTVQRTQAYEALQASEERFRKIIETTDEGIWITDREWKTSYVNSRLERMLGCAPGEMLGRHIEEFMDDEGRLIAREKMAVRETGVSSTHEFKFIRQDGSELWTILSTSPVVTASGQFDGALAMLTDITQRKQTEEELKARDNRFEKLSSNVPGMIYQFKRRPNGTYCVPFTTAAIREVFGCTPEAVHEDYSPITSVILAEDWGGVFHSIEWSAAHMTTWQCTFRVQVPGRPVRWMLGNSTPERLDDGSIIWHGFITDITERKQAEDALIQSQERYRRLFEDAVLGIFRSTPTGELIDANPAFAVMFGFESPEQMKGSVNNLASLYDDPAYRREVVKRLIDARKPIRAEARFLRRDGARFTGNVHLWAVRDEHGNVLHIEGFIEDISERKQAEEAIERLRHQNELILNSAGDGILGLDLEGKHTFVNPAAEGMLGFKLTELIGQGGHGLYHHTKENGDRYPEEECPIYHSYRSGRSCPLTQDVFWRKDGSSFPVRYSSAPLIEDGKVLGAVVTFRDITEQQQIEAEKDRLTTQLAQAQKMEAIGTLAGGIAHDFNNILGIIMGYAEILSLDLPLASHSKESISEVLKAARRAKDLVAQILTFSRKQVQEKKPLLLVPIIKESLKLLRASLPATIEIRREIDLLDGDDLILGDPTQIHQILMNLATNAAHAMREHGGVLSVSLAREAFHAADGAAVRELSPGQYLKLTVQDTGHGMDPGILDRIFDPYFTTKGPGEGTGLGLAVVHGIVKYHNGAITVHSDPGEGTAFQVYLPALEREASPIEVAPVSIPTGSESILVVDDEERLAIAIQRMLEHLGYKALAMTGSAATLSLFRQQPDRFDLLVTDYTMPGMTGIELAKEIIGVRPGFPIILCTGFSEKISEDAVKSVGIRTLLIKPVTLRSLAETVRGVLETE